jgi:hypothetical protein
MPELPENLKPIPLDHRPPPAWPCAVLIAGALVWVAIIVGLV